MERIEKTHKRKKEKKRITLVESIKKKNQKKCRRSEMCEAESTS